MTSKANVEPSLMGQHLTKSSRARGALDWGVEQLANGARDFTPDKTGYARRRYRTKRVSGLIRRLYNTDPFFHLIEFGSANNPAYAPMRKAARALGFKFTETRK